MTAARERNRLGVDGAAGYKLILVNGLTGGHQVSPEALAIAVDGFGAANVILCPTDSSMEMSFVPVGDVNVLVVGSRGLFSAGMEALERQSEYVAAKIAALRKQGLLRDEDKLLLVGHSMGGLASYGAAYLIEQGLTEFPR